MTDDADQPVQVRSTNMSPLWVPSSLINTVTPVTHSEGDIHMSDRRSTHNKHIHCSVEQRETPNTSADGKCCVIDLSHGQTGIPSHEKSGSFNRESMIDIAALGAALQTIVPNKGCSFATNNNGKIRSHLQKVHKLRVV